MKEESPFFFDIERFYNAKFKYPLERESLENYLSGTAFGRSQEYSVKEQNDLYADIRDIYNNVISGLNIKSPPSKRFAVITAGAPGSGKTTVLRQHLKENISKGMNYAYVCHDDVCLRNLRRTFQKDIESCDQSTASRRAIYNKWKPASHGACHLILQNLIEDKCDFYFGTTSARPFAKFFLEFLKAQEYHIKLLHVTAPDHVRWESVQERNKTFIHAAEPQVKEDGFLLPQQMKQVFLAYADEIEFYYRKGVEEKAKLAATWTRNISSLEPLGTLRIFLPNEYAEIKKNHNAVVETLNRPDLDWENSLEKRANIFDCF